MSETGLIALLDQWGCDTRSALERMLDDEEFYADCLKAFLDDEHFAHLGDMLRAENAKEAFLSAHALKGVCANLGLTPLYQAICMAVEPLRVGSLDGVAAYDQEIERQREVLRRILTQAGVA